MAWIGATVKVNDDPEATMWLIPTPLLTYSVTARPGMTMGCPLATVIAAPPVFFSVRLVGAPEPSVIADVV